MNQNLIELRKVAVDFDGMRVLNGIDLEIRDKEFITLLGPSGCGKTTTLRIIGGFVDASEGDVFLTVSVLTICLLTRDQLIQFSKSMRFSHTSTCLKT